ncbi:TetR/AcrR family transcriptional regulator C-terminal domain-containing protein [Streptomyces sp. CB03238]|uniref:TetR/AcrR family transcriptional regulator C-terminal domain-containing protein n=1 Tax=Streptomyces sp. CB03238 TaxID=1907777 RepID=UPI00117F1C64|nr:TetR/AcrR family transcriptional regulator C-terminal domain-containing protein [Streptomyces sp. CB03238]
MTAGPLPADPPGAWQQQLTAFCRTLRTELLRHRDGAKVYGGARFTGTGYAASLEGHLRVMTEAGFTLAQAPRVGGTAYAYTMGFVSEEQGVRPMRDERREGYDIEEWAARLAAHPLAAAAGPEVFTDYDQQVEEGLRMIVAGAEAVYGGPS